MQSGLGLEAASREAAVARGAAAKTARFNVLRGLALVQVVAVHRRLDLRHAGSGEAQG